MKILMGMSTLLPVRTSLYTWRMLLFLVLTIEYFSTDAHLTQARRFIVGGSMRATHLILISFENFIKQNFSLLILSSTN